MQLAADSDSDVTRGLCAVLVKGLHGLKPQELAEVGDAAPPLLPPCPFTPSPSPSPLPLTAPPPPPHLISRHPGPLQVSTDALLALPLGPAVMAPSRTNGFLNMLETARKLARGLMGEMETFPSLLLKANSISAQGPFAESQAQVSPITDPCNRSMSAHQHAPIGSQAASEAECR